MFFVIKCLATCWVKEELKLNIFLLPGIPPEGQECGGGGDDKDRPQ
jgi:hypothetical protein